MPVRIIADRYELEARLGSGGMGTVWKAKDRLLDRTVAVKLLNESLAPDVTFAERFRREARAAARLTHPNVAAVYDTGSTLTDEAPDGIPFIVMEYVNGESLGQMLKREGPLPIEDVVRISRSVLAALGHAHDHGLVHRDIKPANVLFDVTSGIAKVVDFGIAKGLEETGALTAMSGVIGTASYMSPEQVSGRGATPASDLYAAGCLMYCCLAGEPPFHGDTAVTIAMHHLNDPVPPIRTRRADVPASLEAVILRALEKLPSRRFSSAQQMEAAVAATELAAGPSTELWTEDPLVGRIRVLLIDDHDLILKALAAILEPEHDIEVIGSADTAAQGKALAKELDPDIILLDYELPDGDGVSVARAILADSPDIRIVMLTGMTSDAVLAEAIEAGCVGFVPKGQGIDDVIDAVRVAYAGEAPISPALLARLLPRMRHRPPGTSAT